MKFRYSYEKNAQLLSERGIGFEEIIQAIADGNILDIRQHHNQYIIYVRVMSEVYAVPYVEEGEDAVFLKTIFPSRKARKEFLLPGGKVERVKGGVREVEL